MAGATIEAEQKKQKEGVIAVSSTETLFLASMIDCADRRQIRVRYSAPHGLAAGDCATGDAIDPLDQMLSCDDPRQVRFREEHRNGAGAAVA